MYRRRNVSVPAICSTTATVPPGLSAYERSVPPRSAVRSRAIRSCGVTSAVSTVIAAIATMATRDARPTEVPWKAATRPSRLAPIASAPSVRTIPSAGRSRKPVASVPAMPPAVLRARSRPTSCPTWVVVVPRRRAAGNAAPSSSVGASSMPTAASANRAHIAAISLDVAVRTTSSRLDCQLRNHGPSAAISSSAMRPALAINNPKMPHGSRTRSATRA